MEELVLRVQSGDDKAFTELMLYIKDDLSKISRTRNLNDLDRADVLQETMIEIYKSIHKLKEPCKFKKWAIKILINKCNRIYRRKYKYDVSLEEYDLDKFQINSITYIEDNLDFNEIIKILNPDEQLIIFLYYSEEYSVKEISEILKMNENTIYTHLHRARKKLKDKYDGGNRYE